MKAGVGPKRTRKNSKEVKNEKYILYLYFRYYIPKLVESASILAGALL